MRTKLSLTGLLVILLVVCAYRYSHHDAKLTEGDSLFLADFKNTTKESVFDGSLREAVAVSLAQSSLLNVISEEKVSEALGSLGPGGVGRGPQDTALRACQHLGATAYITGSVSREDANFTLGLKAFHCGTDKELASTKAAARGKSEVVHALGVAATELRRELGEDPASIQKLDVPLERATTASLDALSAYCDGRRLTRERGSIDAMPAFKKALELDRRFALAYSNLAVAYYNLNQSALASDSIRQAFELADRQTLHDRLHITTLYDDLSTGDVKKAIASYKEWARLYPRDDIAKGNLASEFFVTGDYDQAAIFAQQALRLDPGSTAWYENLSTAYIALLRLDDAQTVLNQAFARHLEDPSLHANLYALAFLRDDSAAMDREISWSTGKPGGEDTMLALAADTEAYAGHVKKARELSRRAVESAKNSQLTEPAAIWEGIAALRETFYGNQAEARGGAEKVLEIAPSSRDAQILAALVFARAGETRRAQSLTDDLAAGHVSNTVMQSAWLPAIRAEAEIRNHNAERAIELLEVVKPYERGQLIGNLSYSCMIPAYLRGEAYLDAKQGPQALLEFQKLLDNRGVVGNCWSGALARLEQGRAQVLDHDFDRARSSYQQFFALWKDADPDVPILKSARAEFTKLK
jgi:eukaryotic-like serine/threonine-protein kinase